MPDQFRRKKASCCRMMTRYQKSCCRCCKILTTPSKLWLTLFAFLDEWVTRKTIAAFSVLEACAAIGAIVFFSIYSDLVGLSHVFLQTWHGILPFLMMIRLLSSLLGFTAVMYRTVRGTKMYLLLLALNILATSFVCWPLWHCECRCDEVLGASGHHDSSYDTIQCDVLQQFSSLDEEIIVPGTQTPERPPRRRLWKRESKLSSTSHGACFSSAVADTVGKFVTNIRNFRLRFVVAEEDVRYVRHHFFGSLFARLASTLGTSSNYGGPPWSLGQWRSRRLAHVIAESSNSPRGHRVQPSPSNHSDVVASQLISGRALSAYKRFKKIGKPLLEYFNITQTGIHWVAEDGKKKCELKDQFWKGHKPKEVWSSLRKIGEGDKKEFDWNYKQGNAWAKFLGQELERCIKRDYCGLVRARIVQHCWLDKRRPCAYELRICTYDLPVFPVPGDTFNDTEVPDEEVDVFFQKNVRVAMQNILHEQMAEEEAQDKCYALTTLVLLSLMLLNVISIPMFLIVFKFLQAHCGDIVGRESQFSVEFSSDEEWQDDFQSFATQGGSGRSYATRCSNVSRPSTTSRTTPSKHAGPELPSGSVELSHVDQRDPRRQANTSSGSSSGLRSMQGSTGSMAATDTVDQNCSFVDHLPSEAGHGRLSPPSKSRYYQSNFQWS